jgi:hypothetical protein
MKVTKKKIGALEKCYSLAPLTYQGKRHMLVAAEKINQCRMYDLKGNLEDVIWEEPGGTMSMVQVPGSDGQFLATHKFYSPNDSKEAKIILASPTEDGWKIRTMAELPFVHRFDIISKNGINYVIACTLKSRHEYKEDWRSPGKVYVCRLPENLESVDEEHPLEMQPVKEGMLKNHGYCKAVVDGIESSFVASDEGVFRFTPPEEADGAWNIETILEEAASDMAFADFDGDGEMEMLTISPFHGEKICIFKKKSGKYEKIYTYEKDAEFAHAIWGGEINGKQGVLIGHRKAERDLMFFTCTDPEKLTFQPQILDHNVGPANVLHYEYEGEDYILSANREIDEIALYKVEK